MLYYCMYKVEFTSSAFKALRGLSDEVGIRIRRAIKTLANDPHHYRGVTTIQGGPKNRFRIRVGDYRIVFDRDDKIRILLILRIGHRREVYR